MRDAIGSSLLLNIAIVVIGVISAFLIGSIAYSKAYKVKNRIISVIEKYEGKCEFSDEDDCYKDIESQLTDMGYSSNIGADCPDDEVIETDMTNLKDKGILKIERVYPETVGSTGHRYCVYKYTLCNVTQTGSTSYICYGSNENYYYKVFTFMHFDIPVIGNALEFNVSGESKTFYETFWNIKK